jgi:hypothetical protein
MLKPLTQFYCDKCGVLIEDLDNASLEWLSYEHPIHNRHFYKEFRICHNEIRCMKHAKTSKGEGGRLSDYLDEHGYIQLLDRLDRGQEVDPEYHGLAIEDFREYVLLIKRLTIPHYEEARHYWQEALEDGFFDSISKHKYFFQETLTALIRKYSGEADSEGTSE